MKTGPKPTALMDRLLAKSVVNENGCWLWTGATNGRGYGVIKIGSLTNDSRNMAYVHRVSYQLARGPIPDGLFVCHICDVKNCFNPSHLWIGTNSDNIKDAISKGVKIGRANLGEKNGNSKLTAVDVLQIRSYSKFGFTNTDLAYMFNVSKTHIGYILKDKSWKSISHLNPA